MVFIEGMKATFSMESRRMVFIEGMKATFSMESVENGVHRRNESHIQHGECRKWCSSRK